MSSIESVLHESRTFLPSPVVQDQASIAGMQAYRSLVSQAGNDYEGFRAQLASEQSVSPLLPCGFTSIQFDD